MLVYGTSSIRWLDKRKTHTHKIEYIGQQNLTYLLEKYPFLH
jgi:hypothetical protein